MNELRSAAAPWRHRARRGPLHIVQVLNHFISVRGLVVRLLELLLLMGAFLFVNEDFLEGPVHHLTTLIVYVATTLSLTQTFALYERHRSTVGATIGRLLFVYLVVGVAFAGISLFLNVVPISNGDLLATLGLSFGLSLGLRLALPHLSAFLLPSIRVLVIGDGPLAKEVVSILEATDPMEGLELAGQFNPRTGAFQNLENANPRIGTFRNLESAETSISTLAEIIAEEGIGEVVLASVDQRGLPLADLLQYRMEGVQITDYVSFLEREKRYLATDVMRPSWLLFSKGFNHGPARVVAKRLFDIGVSAALLVMLVPFLCLAMLAIFIESGRPIFFRQERVGTGGRPITILKLRSMVLDAEGSGVPQWAQKNDSRITRVGRFIRMTRIDEIPQLISVLKGDMSFVGPRPEREYFVAQLRSQIPYYDLRHTIKPGLSGWAQVSYPYGASIDDARAKLRYDLYYIKNHSLLLDVLILLNTIRIVVFGKGAR